MSLRPAKKDAQVETNPRGRVRVATIQVDGDLSSSLARLLLSTPPNSAPGYPELPTDVHTVLKPVAVRPGEGSRGVQKPGTNSPKDPLSDAAAGLLQLRNDVRMAKEERKKSAFGNGEAEVQILEDNKVTEIGYLLVKSIKTQYIVTEQMRTNINRWTSEHDLTSVREVILQMCIDLAKPEDPESFNNLHVCVYNPEVSWSAHGIYSPETERTPEGTTVMTDELTEMESKLTNCTSVYFRQLKLSEMGHDIIFGIHVSQTNDIYTITQLIPKDDTYKDGSIQHKLTLEVKSSVAQLIPLQTPPINYKYDGSWKTDVLFTEDMKTNLGSWIRDPTLENAIKTIRPIFEKVPAFAAFQIDKLSVYHKNQRWWLTEFNKSAGFPPIKYFQAWGQNSVASVTRYESIYISEPSRRGVVFIVHMPKFKPDGVPQPCYISELHL